MEQKTKELQAQNKTLEVSNCNIYIFVLLISWVTGRACHLQKKLLHQQSANIPVWEIFGQFFFYLTILHTADAELAVCLLGV